MPSTISSFQVLVQAIILLHVYNDYPHFTSGRIKAQSGLVTCHRIHSLEETKLGFKTTEALSATVTTRGVVTFGGVVGNGLSEEITFELR